MSDRISQEPPRGEKIQVVCRERRRCNLLRTRSCCIVSILAFDGRIALCIQGCEIKRYEGISYAWYDSDHAQASRFSMDQKLCQVKKRRWINWLIAPSSLPSFQNAPHDRMTQDPICGVFLLDRETCRLLYYTIEKVILMNAHRVEGWKESRNGVYGSNLLSSTSVRSGS